MKKLHSLVFYALVTPVITLGAGSVLAQQPTGPSMDREQGVTQPTPGITRGDETIRDRSPMESGDYMSSVPADGMQASNLMGATVRTSADEDVGTVRDLLIDEDGQVVALVIGVGGFLGMGEKDVAIGWDRVTKSGTGDDLELRIDMTEDDLRSAPEYEERN
jgi:sporulation protein YlmC with PRC-barrel domain